METPQIPVVLTSDGDVTEALARLVVSRGVREALVLLRALVPGQLCMIKHVRRQFESDGRPEQGDVWNGGRDVREQRKGGVAGRKAGSEKGEGGKLLTQKRLTLAAGYAFLVLVAEEEELKRQSGRVRRDERSKSPRQVTREREGGDNSP